MRICFFGDSFVHGTGDPDRLGWVGRVLRGDITGYNLGVRRDTSANIAARWEAEARVRLPADFPGGIVFSFGANDCAQRIERARTLENTERILSAAWLPALMVGPAILADDSEATARSAELSDDFSKLCARRNVPYLGIISRLLESPVWREEALAGDGAHPGRAGYTLVADAVSEWPAWQRFIARADSASHPRS